MQIKRIMVPFNGSEVAQRGLEVAIDLAKRYEADILVVYVAPIDTIETLVSRPNQIAIGEGNITMPIAPTPQTTEASINRGAQIMEVAKKMCENQGLRVVFEVRQGARNNELIKLASDNVDLVVLGVRRRSKIREFIFGNTATTLLDTTPCSIFMVQYNEEPPAEQPKQG